MHSLSSKIVIRGPDKSKEDPAMRILLVEDDPSTARAIELMLTAASYNVF